MLNVYSPKNRIKFFKFYFIILQNDLLFTNIWKNTHITYNLPQTANLLQNGKIYDG